MKKVDQLAMLLSTDWYLPYWSSAGLFASDSTKSCLQKGYREIVRQIVGNVRQYWLTDFSEKRVAETLRQFKALLESCKVSPTARERTLSLLTKERVILVDSATEWLINQLTEGLLSETNPERTLPDKIIGPLRGLIKSLNEDQQPDFKNACLGSNSEWDVYSRNLTLDLPAYLADYAQEIQESDKFSILWSFINTELPQDARRQLLEWYKTAALSLTGEQLRLPREVA